MAENKDSKFTVNEIPVNLDADCIEITTKSKALYSLGRPDKEGWRQATKRKRKEQKDFSLKIYGVVNDDKGLRFTEFIPGIGLVQKNPTIKVGDRVVFTDRNSDFQITTYVVEIAIII